MIQLWPPKKTKRNHSNCSSDITVMHQDNTKKLQQRDPANFWATWAEAGGYRRRKTCWEREYYVQFSWGRKGQKKSKVAKPPTWRVAKVAWTPGLLRYAPVSCSASVHNFFHMQSKMVPSSQHPPSSLKSWVIKNFPSTQDKWFPWRKPRWVSKMGMWVVCVVGKNAITFIQICKKSSQGQEEQW